ncbi:unnamed protein product [Phaedon cochleariae]|uniref:RING-type domain-containing protein n=1 Tax=Phaedon cochleariae TaxID=80249 RepID=A0A9P0DTN4_PHACE|nr:unnamed protein product [Phaedon cochleariae]
MAELLSKLHDELLAMKCYLCKNVLSLPPIISICEDGKQLKCGRCKDINIPSTGRNFTLESMAKFFSYPCIYEDCNKSMPWDEVQSHEDSCAKKTIKCPIYYQDCEEIVMVQKLREHMENKHEYNIFYGSFTTVMTSDWCNIIVVIYSDQKFLIMIRTISPCHIYVTSLNNTDASFEYDLKLSSVHNDSHSVLIENQTIVKYNERDHCFRCIRNTCYVNYHPHSRINGNVPVNMNCKKIDLSSMKTLFGDVSEIRYTITFHPKEGYEENEKLVDCKSAMKYQTNKFPMENCTKLLRRQLQCPICMKYMMGQIYNCNIGHVLCETCRVQLNNCPQCQMELDSLRNHPLEHLADEVVFPCIFSKNGCHFIGKLQALMVHEQCCGFK